MCELMNGEDLRSLEWNLWTAHIFEWSMQPNFRCDRPNLSLNEWPQRYLLELVDSVVEPQD